MDLTNHCTSSHMLEIVYGLFQLKYVPLIFTIHNMSDWIYTKTERKLTKTLCYIFSMNPQIYRTKNKIPYQNTPHFNKIYFLQSTPHLKPTAPKLRVLYNIYKTYFFQSTSTWRLTEQMRVHSSKSCPWQGDQHT